MSLSSKAASAAEATRGRQECGKKKNEKSSTAKTANDATRQRTFISQICVSARCNAKSGACAASAAVARVILERLIWRWQESDASKEEFGVDAAVFSKFIGAFQRLRSFALLAAEFNGSL